jgi:hypothetical protein
MMKKICRCWKWCEDHPHKFSSGSDSFFNKTRAGAWEGGSGASKRLLVKNHAFFVTCEHVEWLQKVFLTSNIVPYRLYMSPTQVQNMGFVVHHSPELLPCQIFVIRGDLEIFGLKSTEGGGIFVNHGEFGPQMW